MLQLLYLGVISFYQKKIIKNMLKISIKIEVRDMIDFYYKGLSYPRYNIDELMNILVSNNWEIKSIEKSINKEQKHQLK